MALTQRIELRVDDAFADALTELSVRLHKSRAEVIRDALNFYSNAVEEWDREHPANQPKQRSPKAKAESCAV